RAPRRAALRRALHRLSDARRAQPPADTVAIRKPAARRLGRSRGRLDLNAFAEGARRATESRAPRARSVRHRVDDEVRAEAISLARHLGGITGVVRVLPRVAQVG